MTTDEALKRVVGLAKELLLQRNAQQRGSNFYDDYVSVYMVELLIGPACADCGEKSQTQWDDGTPLCYGCAYGRAGWE